MKVLTNWEASFCEVPAKVSNELRIEKSHHATRYQVRLYNLHADLQGSIKHE